MIQIKVTTDKAVEFLLKLQKELQQIPTLLVGSNLVYSYGIEYGVTRNGRLARAAGGAFYLQGAVSEVESKVGSEIVNGLENGGLRNAFFRLGYMAVTGAQSRTPVITGSLRRSIHMVEQ